MTSTKAAFALMLALAAPALAKAQAIENSFRTRLLTAAFQPPAKPFAGDGDVVATIDGRNVKLAGDFKGLASPVTRIRLLTGSAVGIPGGVQVADVPVQAGGVSGAIDAELRLTAAQVALLRGRRIYVQVETQAAPDGALWGWLMPNHPFPGENVPEKANWYAQ